MSLRANVTQPIKALLANIRLGWKDLPETNTRLLDLYVNDEEKKVL
jgi:hypothetical protein